jgi:hypothetical protein
VSHSALADATDIQSLRERETQTAEVLPSWAPGTNQKEMPGFSIFGRFVADRARSANVVARRHAAPLHSYKYQWLQAPAINIRADLLKVAPVVICTATLKNTC